MALMDWFNSVWQNSGLAPLWETVAPWLALDERQLIFMVATPFFIGVFLWEFLKIRHNAELVDTRESIRNFMLGAGYQTTELLFAGLIAFPVYAFAYHHRLLDIELTWFTGALLWVLTDFCFYWMHRTSHRVRWFWAAHVTHHSSERMNFSTAMRQNATNIFNGMWIFYLPLALLGLNPVWIGVAYALSLVYQFFIHTTLVGKLPRWLELVFNTPSHQLFHTILILGPIVKCCRIKIRPIRPNQSVRFRIDCHFIKEKFIIECTIQRPPKHGTKIYGLHGIIIKSDS